MGLGFYYLADASPRRLSAQITELGASRAGIDHMLPKGQTLCFKVTGLKNAAALILKQELLAKGGEAALAQDAIMGANHEQAVILMATPACYRLVCQNLLQQPFGLAALAQKILSAIDTLFSAQAAGRPQIMGIANITPDSFYDGGQYNQPQQAARHILAMAEAGADIIDIGAASSRPGHTPISREEELERLLPVLKLIAPRLNIPISVDTDKAAVAREALAAGASIINDIGGLQPDMAQLGAESGARVVLMHQGGGENLPEEVQDFFAAGIERGLKAGMRREQFILDPGLGFGKTPRENLLLLKHTADFKIFGLPLLIALSNKRFIGAATGKSLGERTAGNISASVWAMTQGAAIIRTHEVKELVDAMHMLEAINKGGDFCE